MERLVDPFYPGALGGTRANSVIAAVVGYTPLRQAKAHEASRGSGALGGALGDQ